jgi:outer membrane protein assembly factor BamB
MTLVRLGVFGLLLAAPAAASADWPQFRGPTGMGVATSDNLPDRWGQEDNLAWKVELPGPGTSSPIVRGQKVYLTCYTGSGESLKRHLLCLDLKDGKTLWTADVPAKLPEQESIRENHGYASSTPAADAERVYAFFGKSGVYAFDHDGRELWRADVGAGLNGWGSAASPVLVGDLVIVNASVESESLVALDRATGKEKWRSPGIRESWATPVLVTPPGGKPELVVPIIRKLLGIDPETGKQLWSCDTGINWYMVPSVVAHDGVVYCVGGRSGDALAVKAGGRGDVTNTHRLWAGKRGSNVTSPVYHDGKLYWMSDNLGVAYRADAKTGAVEYEHRVERAGQVYASPILAGGKVYYVARDGRTYVVRTGPAFDLVAVNDLRDHTTFNASPAVAGDRLLIRSDRYLYCIGK